MLVIAGARLGPERVERGERQPARCPGRVVDVVAIAGGGHVVARDVAFRVVDVAGPRREQIAELLGVLGRPRGRRGGEVARAGADGERIGGVVQLVEEGVGEGQGLGPHGQAVLADLAGRQAGEHVAVVEAAGMPGHPQRHAAPAIGRWSGQHGITQLGHGRHAVVDNLIAGRPADPVHQVVPGVVPPGVRDGRIGGQVRL